MTMPCESKRALEYTHEFLVSLLTMNKQSFRKMTKAEFMSWRWDVSRCLRHYPMQYQIDRMYEDQVCAECGQSKPFHRNGCLSKNNTDVVSESAENNTDVVGGSDV
jgi:hypothetical protein